MTWAVQQTIVGSLVLGQLALAGIGEFLAIPAPGEPPPRVLGGRWKSAGHCAATIRSGRITLEGFGVRTPL
jgi:hypothetical protein